MSDRPKKEWGPLKIGCVGILAAPLLWLGYAICWSYTAEPGTGNDAAKRFEELIAQHQPKDADGAAGYRAVQDAIALFDEEERGFRADYAKAFPNGWPIGIGFPFDFVSLEWSGVPEIASTQTRLFFDRLKKAGMPAALDHVAGHKAFARPFAGQASTNWIPNSDYGRLLAIARYNGARMFVAVSEGDDNGVLASFNSTLGLARSSAAEPMLSSRSIAIGMALHGTYNLRAALIETRLSPQTLAALAESLETQTQWPPLEVSLEGERAVALHYIEMVFTDDGDGDGRIILTEANPFIDMIGGKTPSLDQAFGESRVKNVAGFFYPGRKETLAFAHELFDSFVESSRQPVVLRRTAEGSERVLTVAERQRFPIVSIFIPSMELTVRVEAIYDSTLTGTRLMLAIERYRALHGSCPDKLDQLVPAFLTAVPTDPFTGTPYGYIRYAHPDEFRRDFLLYSYGSNLRDDGGVYNAEFNLMNDSAEASAANNDFIFNVPRAKYLPKE